MSQFSHLVVSSLASVAFARLADYLMAKMNERRTEQMNFRVAPELRDQLDRACQVVKEDQSNVIRCCLEAFIEAVERDGEITKPYAIIAKSKLPKADRSDGCEGERVLGLNEDPAVKACLNPPLEKLKSQPVPTGAVHAKKKPGSTTSSTGRGAKYVRVEEEPGSSSVSS